MYVCEVVDYPVEGVIEILWPCVKWDGESQHCVNPAWNSDSKSGFEEEQTCPEEPNVCECYSQVTQDTTGLYTTANVTRDKGNSVLWNSCAGLESPSG